jgi:cytochrome c oxidase subunit 2
MGDDQTKPESEDLKIADRPNGPILPMLGIAAVASALGVILGILINWFPISASTQADQVDTFYDVLIAASVPVFVLVTAVVLYSVWRFRMRPGEENMDGPPIHGNTRLEVIWTTIPALMMLALCVYAAIELSNAEEAPAKPAEELNVRVVGEQFTWTFFYKDPKTGKEFGSPQLYLPIDESVKFNVQTKDVLHDFWVPEFRWKIDAVPGITTKYRVTPNRIGTYKVVCAELCGLGHATMRQTVRVITQDEYTKWVTDRAAEMNGGGAPPADGGETPPEGGGETASADGAAVFEANGCGGCHVMEAAGATGTTGPNLDEVLADKDAAFIEESIVDPEAEIADGYNGGIMPTSFGDTLSPEELQALVKYIEESTKG